MSSRPEHLAPPEIFYDNTEAKKYAQSSRIRHIQTQMSERAIELLCLPQKYLDTVESNNSGNDEEDDGSDEDSESGDEMETSKMEDSTAGESNGEDNGPLNPDFVPQLVLDVGCGSGISGEVLRDMGHHWIGVDISRSMLDVANARHADGDMFEHDMGQGMFFRIGVFDAVISISALQWLCNADKKDHIPQKRLARFFSTLYRSVKKGGRCVFQFYPENSKQTEMITKAALKAGFSGGVVVDFPNSARARKYFLCLFAGIPDRQVKMPDAMTDETQQQTIRFTEARKQRSRERRGKRSALKGSREWIVRKKERDLRRGKDVRATTKNSGRKRRTKF